MPSVGNAGFRQLLLIDTAESVFDSEIVECRLILVLCCQAGVGQVAVDVAPFTKPSIVEHLQLVGDDKRYDGAMQAFLEHDETAHTTIAVLERMYLFEADVQVEDILQRALRLSVVPSQEALHTFLYLFRLTGLFTTHLIRQTLIVTYSKPVLAAVAAWSVLP